VQTKIDRMSHLARMGRKLHPLARRLDISADRHEDFAIEIASPQRRVPQHIMPIDRQFGQRSVYNCVMSFVDTWRCR
jgi:hypothetical protein